jgi:hypothetical protein
MGRAGLRGRGRIGAEGQGDAMITDLALTIAAIVVFVIMAELAWRPFQRRHIDRPLPTDPIAQAANIGGIVGGGCARPGVRGRRCRGRAGRAATGIGGYAMTTTMAHEMATQRTGRVGRPFTPEEDETLRRLALEGHTRRQIATQWGGHTIQSVTRAP